MADLKHLQLTQDEMMKKLSIMDEEQNETSSLKPLKRLDGMSKKIGWRKGWNWKQSPVKSASIEEEPIGTLESPKKSLQSSKSSTPNLSPKHNVNLIRSAETVSDGAETGSVLVRRKQRKSENIVKSELRSSASARLLQYLESKDTIDKISSDEFFSLIPDNNGRPASIHVIQSSCRNDDVL